uniref:Uncharacterized protein n=1 Tax=Rhizophora mucronata TaxID=61149 RepID=A0A2P2J7X6_RHIMU
MRSTEKEQRVLPPHQFSWHLPNMSFLQMKKC